MSHFISYKGFHWEYELFGNGDEMLLAFHGFGKQGSDFRILEQTLGKKYKIVAFNLPYHGKSRIDESALQKVISKVQMKELFRLFLQQHHIEKFSLMGYSLGGKIVLQLIEFFSDKINTVFLFAPDGIRSNMTSGFVTRNALGKKLYAQVMNNPARLFSIVKMLRGMKLIHEKMSEFVHSSLSTQEKRQQVWNVWMCFRDIRPDIPFIQRLINNHHIKMHLFFGKYDRIIPPSIGENFLKKLSDKNCLHIVEMGHNLIQEKMNGYLLNVAE